MVLAIAAVALAVAAALSPVVPASAAANTSMAFCIATAFCSMAGS